MCYAHGGLRVKDINLETREIIVRQGKGNKDRVTSYYNSCDYAKLIAPMRYFRIFYVYWVDCKGLTLL
jgi:integrase